tara:strand:+ start:566 stop:1567 length:1002 start_codon:yes stop_codon:yes gene_type:complete
MGETNQGNKLDANLFKNMVSNNWNAVVFANMNNIVDYVNPSACKLYGYKENELLGQTTDVFNSHLTHNTDEIVASIKEKGYWFGEIIQRKKDGSTFTALLSVQLIFNENNEPIGFASNSKDITLDIESAVQLKKTIEDKEILLRELHHRVKNNLALILGILNLQNGQNENNCCNVLIEDFKNRVDALATLHNTLYQVENLKAVDLKVFIEDLCANLSRSFENNKQSVSLNLALDNYVADISHAIPLGLIINEVVTNSYKHAFNEEENGTIEIELLKEGNNTHLTIHDNGSGFEFEAKKSNSLGLSLINDLSEQIDANYSFEQNQGTKFILHLN